MLIFGVTSLFFHVQKLDAMSEGCSSPVIPLLTSTVGRINYVARRDRGAQLGLSFTRRCSFEANQSYPKMSKLDADVTVHKPSLEDFQGLFFVECRLSVLMLQLIGFLH
jgi:hypothetical protein